MRALLWALLLTDPRLQLKQTWAKIYQAKGSHEESAEKGRQVCGGLPPVVGTNPLSLTPLPCGTSHT
jgi:hypothetical protein